MFSMNQHNTLPVWYQLKQKVENAVAADYERTRAAGKEWTLANCKTMVRAMYPDVGFDTDTVVHDYFLRLFDIKETPARPIVRLTGASHTPSIARGDSVEDCYVDASELERQFPAYSDRSNKE